LGGNLCHAVPSADYAVPLIVLDSRVKLLSPSGERILPISEFMIGVKQTALKSDEMLIEVQIPTPPPRTSCTFQRVGRSSVDIALVNAAVRLSLDNSSDISHARVALGAVAPVPLRSVSAEEKLIGKNITVIDEEFLEKVGEQAASETRPISDVRTSAVYRKEISKILVIRALKDAIGQLQEKYL
jgi:carbon-monoxide dehydrogenase medium subunit